MTYGIIKGSGIGIPPQLVELIRAPEVRHFNLTRGGVIVYFVESRQVRRLLERFIARAEALRDSFPLLGIGVAQETLAGQFDWLGRLKRNFKVAALTEQCALEGIQSAQTYRGILQEIQ